MGVVSTTSHPGMAQVSKMSDGEIVEDLRRRLAAAEAALHAGADAGAPRGADDGRRALVLEHQHRVRSILATIRSIASRMVEGSSSVEDYGAHLVGRIDAIGRTQMSLAVLEGLGSDLETLVRDEMLAQLAPAERFEIDGPDVELSEATAVLLTLALHELGTNAMKYGALSDTGGLVRIEWRTEMVDDTEWLHLLWKESGVPIASVAPRAAGLGTELIQRRIAYELRGRGALEFQPGGVSCTIEVPLHRSKGISRRG